MGRRTHKSPLFEVSESKHKHFKSIPYSESENPSLSHTTRSHTQSKSTYQCSLMLETTHPCEGRTTDIPNPKPINDIVPAPGSSLPPCRHDAGGPPSAAITASPFMVTTVATSWLRNRRIRYLFFLLCSPLLLLFLCAVLPFICATELWGKLVVGDSSGDDEQLRRCEEGCCGGDEEEKGLLHRYLKDQLLLVGSMYECGEDEEPELEGVEDIENLNSIRAPLLG